MKTTVSLKADLVDCLERRDIALEIWSIHVDEVSQWHPKNESFDEWFKQLCAIYTESRLVVGELGVVVATLTLKVSDTLETFEDLSMLEIDFFTPPSIYVLKNELEFPYAGEQYYRVIQKNIVTHPEDSIVIVRSSRSLQGLEKGWEFDNAIYITPRFGGA